MDNNGLNDASRNRATAAIVGAVFLYKMGYFDALKEDVVRRTDVVQAMGIGVGQDNSFLGMDSTYMNPSN